MFPATKTGQPELSQNTSTSWSQAVRLLPMVGAKCSSLAWVALVVFSAALPASATSLVHDIKAVSAPSGARELCQQYIWACDRSSRTTIPNASVELKIADRVNRAVNRSVREISDRRQYGRPEVWSLPTGRGGDCEDFALLKKRELIRLGLAPSKLAIATALDRRRNSHAVLIIRTDQGDYVLDNLTDRMKPWHATGYSFLRMQDITTPSGWIMVERGGIFPG